MKKIIIGIVLILTVLLAGCTQQPVVAQTPEKSAEQPPKQTAEQTIVPETSPQPSIEVEVTPEATQETVIQPKINIDDIDQNQMSKFFDMNKNEIIELLGNNYEIFQTPEGDWYCYKEFGLTFVFDELNNDNKVCWIGPFYEDNDDSYSPKLYQIYGVNSDMNFQQIEDTLGKKGKTGEGFEYTEESQQYAYTLSFKKNNYTLGFSSSSKDGTDQRMYCFSNE